MSDRIEKPTLRELLVAAVGGIAWAALGLLLWGAAPVAVQATACRVHNRLGAAANVGSGTLVDVTADGERGLVLTCAHLLAEGVGQVVVEFADGRTHGALVTAIDRQADLAALEIAQPAAAPSTVDFDAAPTGRLRACGFGPAGEYRCLAGQAVGFSDRPGQRSVRMTGAVRSGDSGGGVFDEGGRLTAVVWGACDGVTYASTGGPLRTFLARVLPARCAAGAATSAGGACVDGRCPLVRPGTIGAAPAGRGPAAANGGGAVSGLAPPPRSPACDCGGRLAAIDGRIAALERQPSAAAPAASPPPEGFAATARTLATLGVAALGLSGPAGWGVIAAATVAGWYVGRRRRRKLRVARREAREVEVASQLASRASQRATPPEATAAAEVSFPIERDDREARELLRLSQLEGRDPLQDAVAGRLALDRLDALAESDADPVHADWADRLRRELRERFNDIAPTKFQVKAEG